LFKIIGILKKSEGEQYMVIELMVLGDLRTLLRQKGGELTLKQLVRKKQN
jgi:hypothetical protein